MRARTSHLRWELCHQWGRKESISDLCDVDVLVASHVMISLIILRYGDRQILHLLACILWSSKRDLYLASLADEGFIIVVASWQGSQLLLRWRTSGILGPFFHIDLRLFIIRAHTSLLSDFIFLHSIFDTRLNVFEVAWHSCLGLLLIKLILVVVSMLSLGAWLIPSWWSLRGPVWSTFGVSLRAICVGTGLILSHTLGWGMLLNQETTFLS